MVKKIHRMNRICLVVLIGLPGAGKTTFCRKCCSYYKKFKIYHVCYDDFVKFDSQDYKLQRKGVLEYIDQLISRELSNENPINTVILIDDNNFYSSMRYEFYKLANNFHISFAQIYFSISLQVGIMRNSGRNNEVPKEVIQKMYERLEVNFSKNKWERNTFTLNADNEIDFEEVELFLSKSFELPVAIKPHETKMCLEQSQIHKIDLVLRKHIGCILQGTNNKSLIAKQLNDKRKQILVDIKSGAIECTQNFDIIVKLLYK